MAFPESGPLSPSPALAAEIEASGLIHRPLPLHRENSLENLGRRKGILKSRPIADPENPEGWTGKGGGKLSCDGILSPLGYKSLRMELPCRTAVWPEDNPAGDYTPFCRQSALYRVGGENWEDYNRVSFRIYPDCPGARVITLTLVFTNEGKFPVPDAYGREGRHELVLANRQWNEGSLEIPELPRDRITSIGFESAAYGQDRSAGPFLRFYIGELTLEQIEECETVRGWLPGKNRVAYSMAGYPAGGTKTAVMAGDASGANKRRAGGSDAGGREFCLKNRLGERVYTGKTRPLDNALGSFEVMDFSEFQVPGEYSLHSGAASTGPFAIGEGIWADSIWKGLNFIFCERCGYPVPEKHGSCHGDVLAEHNGLRLAYNGGWHDAGDLSQQSLQTADVTFNLLEMARRAEHEEPGLYRRLLEEAEWGLDFILKCRFGDGWRASSAGILHWSDGFIGNMDDRPARTHNNAFDNFLYAAYEAYAAETLRQDPMLAEKLLSAAEEDFAFAQAVRRERGFSEKPEFWEHSYSMSPSLYMAALSWSASMLYKTTGKEEYAREAAEAAAYVLDCRHDREPGPGGLSGFFYRGRDRRIIQHFNHQSRDQLYMQALALLIETQDKHPERGKWQKAVEGYAVYLKKAAAHTQPYGMLPSGVYHIDEARDPESFDRQHRFPGENALEEYAEQFRSGIPLDDEHCLRIFPVWYSFRGNAAVHLATGKAAAICGRLLGDRELIELGREQLYWLLGKNPFCQSLMYGEGSNYPEQAVFLPGTMTGALPVGIQTRYNEDLPYWPQANNATYKEAWLSTAGKWLSLAAELA
jgi:hypothetical protein